LNIHDFSEWNEALELELQCSVARVPLYYVTWEPLPPGNSLLPDKAGWSGCGTNHPQLC
jgi:hypothetical protein